MPLARRPLPVAGARRTRGSKFRPTQNGPSFGALWILHPRTPTGPPKAPVLSEKRPGDRSRCPSPVAPCPLPVPGAPGGQNFDRPKMAQKQLKTTSHTVIRCFGALWTLHPRTPTGPPIGWPASGRPPPPRRARLLGITSPTCFGALWTLHPRTPTGPPKAPVLSEKRPGDRCRCPSPVAPWPLPGAPGGQNFDRPKMDQNRLETTSHTVIRCFLALWISHPRTRPAPPLPPVLSRNTRPRRPQPQPVAPGAVGGPAPPGAKISADPKWPKTG